MTKKYITLAFLFFLLFLQTPYVHGWDNKRRGFILGFGLGSGFTSFDDHKEDGGKNRQYKLPVMIDFKIGYSINDLWQIYWTTKNSFFRLPLGFDPNTGSKEDVTMWRQVSGLGCSYFFKPEAPSPFIVAGIGRAAFAEFWPSERDGGESTERLGLFGGGGFEFSPGWSLEMVVCWDNIPGREFLSLRTTVNVLWY